MNQKEPSSEKYPGNDWLAEKLVEHDLQFSVAFVHGIIRGSIANPMMVEPAEAIAEIFDKKKADKMSISDLEVVFMGMFALWKETAVSFHVPTTFPNAVMTRPGSGAAVRTFNSDIVDLANGFMKGFSLKPIPKKIRSEAVASTAPFPGTRPVYIRRVSPVAMFTLAIPAQLLVSVPGRGTDVRACPFRLFNVPVLSTQTSK